MICYKDRTFCDQDCGNRECPDNFNEDDYAEAKAWWGGGDDVPIMFDNLKTDACGFVEVA